MIDATLVAWLSRPTGKMIRAVSVLICFHFKEGGLPPNCWENKEDEIKTKTNKNRALRMKQNLRQEVTE